MRVPRAAFYRRASRRILLAPWLMTVGTVRHIPVFRWIASFPRGFEWLSDQRGVRRNADAGPQSVNNYRSADGLRIAMCNVCKTCGNEILI